MNPWRADKKHLAILDGNPIVNVVQEERIVIICAISSGTVHSAAADVTCIT